jgi:cytochrome c oxidase subunit 2
MVRLSSLRIGLVALPSALALGLAVAPVAAQHSSPHIAPVEPDTLPMNYVQTSGTQALQIQPLLWGLTILSVVVVVIIALLVVTGVIIRGRSGETRDVPIGRSGNGPLWIYVGVGITTVVLVFFTGWTVVTMAGISSPPAPAALTIAVTGHQWWWEFTYTDPDHPSAQFVTANEIHIPVGVPVAFALKSADVIHSFWIPALGGKIDLIPGRTNTMWLEAEKPGVYRGQCAEYCGLEHAQMALRVIADTPDDYEAWRENQLAEAVAPKGALQTAGEQQFVLRCGACHAVRGTPAGGIVGPDLTHLMSRETIAAGMLTNNAANLSGWIADPQAIKPGAKMPNLELSGPELNAIRNYLLILE